MRRLRGRAVPLASAAMDDGRARAIEALLVETEAAHAVFERDELGGVVNGRREGPWTAWYANYAVDHGLGEALGREVAASEVAAFMTTAWDEVTASGSKPDAPWSTWMARRLASDL